MYNIIIFPYDDTLNSILSYIDENVYDVKGLVSPCGWGYCANEIKIGRKNLKVYGNIDQVKENYNSICIVNSRYDLDFEKYILPVLKECKEKNLDVILCRDLLKKEIKFVKQYIKENKLHIIHEKYDVSKFQDEIYDINTPVVFIVDMLTEMHSENVSSEVYIELEKRGYKTYLLSAKKEKKLINSVDVIPEIVINNKGYNREKILKFNHYIKQVEIIEHPDLIIVEAPGNLLEISKMVTGDFGSGAYIISRGISLDYVICNMPYFSGFSEKCDDLGQCIEARIEAEVDAYNITSQYLDLADAEENGVIEYMDVSRDLIVDEIKNNEEIYYLQEKTEISRVVDDIIKKLESYAEIELI